MTSAFDQLYLGGDNVASPNIFDEYANNFAAVNMGQGDFTTVSPQDLTLPAPSSGTLSFDTPDSSLFESPAIHSTGYNTTPLHDSDLDMMFDYQSKMAPLFDKDDDQFGHIPLNPGVQMNYSPALAQGSSISSPMVRQHSATSSASPMVRQKSSPGRPAILGAGHGRKASLTTGVAKPARSRGDLPPIEINSDDDKDTAKRKKNTAAARKSRMRRNNQFETVVADNNRLRAMLENLGFDPEDSSLLPVGFVDQQQDSEE